MYYATALDVCTVGWDWGGIVPISSRQQRAQYVPVPQNEHGQDRLLEQGGTTDPMPLLCLSGR